MRENPGVYFEAARFEELFNIRYLQNLPLLNGKKADLFGKFKGDFETRPLCG